ncbi:DNA internalization-related competence protein ComEC/Rec2 [Acinetobacter tianfuensis]|uniref:DNA internalization-related competence protein ComEC/Rec2 n=1 Tax=Acinetobacter tianfuensis TaxID=2419603 RepID=A0A3A8EPF5_9GAMM|nr:DNA internalization-related competence protein ComEC/Rec2 [Acinetobacter tianfuensis]RKG32630.1 DNA internalization-related competence protein ComEC/Rec2 [Acinetobacter tianfuensis]
MWLWFGLGWIFGISRMGRADPDLHISALFTVICWLTVLAVSALLVKLPFFLKFWIGMAGLCLGAVLGMAYANQQLEQRLKHTVYETGSAELIVYISKMGQLNENSIQQRMDVLSADRQRRQYLAYLPVKGKQRFEALELGKYYRIEGSYRPAHSYAVQGAFDQEKWLLQQNIQSGFKVKNAVSLSAEQIYAMGYTDIFKRHAAFDQQFLLWIEQQRLNFREFILHQPLRHKGLLLALLTGDKSLLDDTVTEQFQRYGMSHLLAISGPHVVIFAVLFCFSLKMAVNRFCPRLYLRIPRHYLLLFPFLGCVFLYCAFVGFEIPAMRTLLMCVIASLMILLRLKLQVFKLLLISASLLLLIDPFSILSAAFWLSYGACFILLRIYQTMAEHQQRMNAEAEALTRFKLTVRILIESQWKIFIALIPLTLLFFQQFAWIAPFSNILAIPWLGLVIVPLDVVAALSYYLSADLSSMLFLLNDWCLAVMLGLMNLCDQLLNPQLQPLALNGWMIFLIGFCLAILFLPNGLLPKSLAGLGFIVLLVKSWLPYPFELQILDVGQGQAVFIRDGTKTMMVDMGGNYDEQKFSVGKQIVLPFLHSNAVSQLDRLVLTHLDQDHSGGYFSIQQQLPVKILNASESVQPPIPAQFEYCLQGQRWQLGQASIDVLSPKNVQAVRAGANRNENSCVLYVTLAKAAPYQSFLLMGDAGWKTEYQLLQDYPDLHADVLVLGHHGSRHSSSYEFLQAIQPKLAIASAGKFNRYGHPSLLTKTRLKALQIPMLNTAEQGSIRFLMQQGHVEIKNYRTQRRWLQRQ